MLLTGGGMSVGLVTIHQSLASVPGAITIDEIVRIGQLTRHAHALHGQPPRLAGSSWTTCWRRRCLWPRRYRGRQSSTRTTTPVSTIEGPLPPDTAFTLLLVNDMMAASVCTTIRMIPRPSL